MLSGSALFDQSANALTIRRKFLQRISLQLFHRISKSFWYLLETHSTSASKKAVCIFILARSADLIGSILFVNHCKDQGRCSGDDVYNVVRVEGKHLPSCQDGVRDMGTVAKHRSLIIVIIAIVMIHINHGYSCQAQQHHHCDHHHLSGQLNWFVNFGSLKTKDKAGIILHVITIIIVNDRCHGYPAFLQSDFSTDM